MDIIGVGTLTSKLESICRKHGRSNRFKTKASHGYLVLSL
jgi:hypothetical protein